MNEQKGFLTKLGELIDHHRLEKRQRQTENTQTPHNLSRRFLRWLTPNGGTLLLVAMLIITQQVWAGPLLGTTNTPGSSAATINYQGRLANPDGSPVADGNYGMRFAIYDALTDGNLMWGPQVYDSVPVTDGLFSVPLTNIDQSLWFGDRYLEITVDGETLSPREPIRSVPISQMALTVPDGAIGSRQVSPTFFQGFPSGEINVPAGTGDADNLIAIELTVDFPVDATYLIHTTMVTRGGADTRIMGRSKDEDGNWIGQAIHNSHPIGGMAGTQTGSTTAIHHFSAGSHTLTLIVWGGGGYVRGGSSITAIPFAQAP